MKTTKILYWTVTIIIVLLEGVMPALTSNTELAKEGIRHLGYPDYFRVALTIFKVAGSIGLILPAVKGNLKEWIYAGFAFDFIFATLSHTVVDGFSLQILFPVGMLVLLIISHVTYHKIKTQQTVRAAV